jgi:hypothetical protein
MKEAKPLPRGSGAAPSAMPERRSGITAMRVTDDLGEHIEIRAGEVIIVGRLIDRVIDDLRTKRANKE